MAGVLPRISKSPNFAGNDYARSALIIFAKGLSAIIASKLAPREYSHKIKHSLFFVPSLLNHKIKC